MTTKQPETEANGNQVQSRSLDSLVRLDFFRELEGERIICWFSCGVTSAVACKMAIIENDGKLPLRVIYCDTRSEHPDNKRFLRECEEWLGCKIEILTSKKYKDVDDVIERERYINGPYGAKCTQQLKIALRLAMQRPETDYHVYGFDLGEIDRVFDFREHFPEIRLMVPLVDRKLTKGDCLAMLREKRIEPPIMYKMGYRNNNCIGCVKGGMGYWNKIRVDFPEVFAKRAAQERSIGATCINGVYLDELEPNRGRYEAEPDISCEGFCVDAKREMEQCLI